MRVAVNDTVSDCQKNEKAFYIFFRKTSGIWGLHKATTRYSFCHLQHRHKI